MNASSTDTVERLERLGFILIAALVPSLRFSGVWGFRICDVKCGIQQLSVFSRNARGCSELADSVVVKWCENLASTTQHASLGPTLLARSSACKAVITVFMVF